MDSKGNKINYVINLCLLLTPCYIFRDHCLDGEAEPPSPAPGPPSSTWSARRTSPTRPRISTSAPESGTTMSSSRLEMGGTRTTTYDVHCPPGQNPLRWCLYQHIIYSVFIKYCVFSEFFKIFRTLFFLGVSLCTQSRQVENQRCCRTAEK